MKVFKRGHEVEGLRNQALNEKLWKDYQAAEARAEAAEIELVEVKHQLQGCTLDLNIKRDGWIAAEQRVAELERTLEAFVDNENQLMEEATG